jgi:hypothetical protein
VELLTRHPSLTVWELRYHLRQRGLYVSQDEGQRLVALRPDQQTAPREPSWRPLTRPREIRAYWFVLGAAGICAAAVIASSIGHGLMGR